MTQKVFKQEVPKDASSSLEASPDALAEQVAGEVEAERDLAALWAIEPDIPLVIEGRGVVVRPVDREVGRVRSRHTLGLHESEKRKYKPDYPPRTQSCFVEIAALEDWAAGPRIEHMIQEVAVRWKKSVPVVVRLRTMCRCRKQEMELHHMTLLSRPRKLTVMGVECPCCALRER
jgi:hypothetical protein